MDSDKEKKTEITTGNNENEEIQYTSGNHPNPLATRHHFPKAFQVIRLADQPSMRTSKEH